MGKAQETGGLPCGKRLQNNGKTYFQKGKLTIRWPCSMAMLNYQRVAEEMQGLVDPKMCAYRFCFCILKTIMCRIQDFVMILKITYWWIQSEEFMIEKQLVYYFDLRS